MAGEPRSSPGAGTPGAVVVAAAVAVGLMVGAGGLTAVLLLRERRGKAAADDRGAPSRVEGGEGAPCPLAPVGTPAGMRVPAGSWHEADMTPPLPDDVVRLLQASRLCFLSTFSDDHPHLSLMNFTYYPADEVIILSTRRDTKKYKLVQAGRNVAILVHEFPDAGGGYSSGGGGSGGGCTSKVTITLNGRATIQEGEQAERYRDLHARKNPDSKTFIVGPNIAIITVRVRSARICNVRDEVTHWNVADSGPPASTPPPTSHTTHHLHLFPPRSKRKLHPIHTKMTRFLAISMGLASLGAAAGASSASTGTAKNENGLRGAPAERKLDDHYVETKFCNSIGCPNGFQPIDNAWEVECENGVCEVDQCCQAFCSSFPCPDGFTPISYASTTRCYDDYCTQEQCCEAFCSYHPCPDGYIPIDNAGDVLCNDDICTTEQCCDLVDQGGHHRNRKLDDHYVETKFCNSIGCPNGFQPIDNAWEVECENGVCEVDQCCQAFCSSFPCPDGFTPISYASTTRCYDDYCTQEQCCEAFCSYHPCPDGYIPIDNAGDVLCNDDICTTEQCCDLVDQGGHH
eukprot:g2589.t1